MKANKAQSLANLFFFTAVADSGGCHYGFRFQVVHRWHSWGCRQPIPLGCFPFSPLLNHALLVWVGPWVGQQEYVWNPQNGRTRTSGNYASTNVTESELVDRCCWTNERNFCGHTWTQNSTHSECKHQGDWWDSHTVRGPLQHFDRMMTAHCSLRQGT